MVIGDVEYEHSAGHPSNRLALWFYRITLARPAAPIEDTAGCGGVDDLLVGSTDGKGETPARMVEQWMATGIRANSADERHQRWKLRPDDATVADRLSSEAMRQEAERGGEATD